MFTVQLTDEELAGAMKYLSNRDLRDYMNNKSSGGVSMALSDAILKQLKNAVQMPKTLTPPLNPKPANPRADAIWNAVTGSAGRSNT